MARKLRLDAVVQLREQEEKKALEALGAAVQATVRAADALRLAQERATRDERRKGPVESWQLQEIAHERALQEVKACAARLEKARQDEKQARAKQLEAYQRAEVVRRVAAARRLELDRDEARAENKAMDEQAAIRHERKEETGEG